MALTATSLFLLRSTPSQAQDEFLINDDRVPRTQFSPTVARGSTGALVVAWSDSRNGTDQDPDYDIYAMTVRDPLAIGSTSNRRLNDDGTALFQGMPDLAGSPVGTFLCVWEDSRAANSDIFGVALDSLGFRTSPNLRINDDAGFGDQRNPRLAFVPPDRFLVVWGDQRGGNSEIFGAYRNVSGAPIGANFIISQDPVIGGSVQSDPAVAVNANGLTLVVWRDSREGGSGAATTFDIYGQWLDASGNPVGGNFKVNGTTGTQQNESPAVAADPTQGFVVGWIDRRSGLAIDPGDVYAQRYSQNRIAVGLNVRVNDDPLGRNQRAVRAAPGPDGAYLFWEDLRGGFGQDPNVEAARVPYDGSAVSPNFRVNGTIGGRQGTPCAAWDGNGAFLAAWEDSRNGLADIYAVSCLPSGVRRGLDAELNDDAARNDQWRPRMGKGPGEYVLTWIDRRNLGNDLFGQWVSANGGRTGANLLLYRDTGLSHAVTSDAALLPSGTALAVAQVTRDSDVGEIRGFLFTSPGAAPAATFWISDSLQSAQADPAVAPGTNEFAVAWIDSRGTAPRIFGQRIAASGARFGSNHPLLDAEPPDPPYALDLAPDPAGGYWLLYAEGIGDNQALWLEHLDASLNPEGAAVGIAGSNPGPKENPRLSVSPDDGRIEVVWQGIGVSGLPEVYQLALGSGLNPIGPVFALGDPLVLGSRTKPTIAMHDMRSVVSWQERRDGSWGVWVQVFLSGANPLGPPVHVDEDPGQTDQLEPGVGIDVAGHVLVAWADTRSTSSGSDILARVIDVAPTAVDPVPIPDPDPPPSPPSRMRVGPARANPFSAVVGIPVELPQGAGARMQVRVLDARGSLVSRLYDGEAPSARFLIRWNGTDSSGHEVASGVYWLLVEAEGERHALRLVRIR